MLRGLAVLSDIPVAMPYKLGCLSCATSAGQRQEMKPLTVDAQNDRLVYDKVLRCENVIF